ncbi:hypothetical protein NDU88_000909 [Pleurodeles waltl]|uniref:Uncharacterized protein n=1 Tax=Pleurodeles waltl TaxID=8319 RepID=A0AAV7URV2_PLEWA|nr:hypothetical protein NDU88_000909 [Pleurodeles waltl]
MLDKDPLDGSPWFCDASGDVSSSACSSTVRTQKPGEVRPGAPLPRRERSLWVPSCIVTRGRQPAAARDASAPHQRTKDGSPFILQRQVKSSPCSEVAEGRAEGRECNRGLLIGEASASRAREECETESSTS